MNRGTAFPEAASGVFPGTDPGSKGLTVHPARWLTLSVSSPTWIPVPHGPDPPRCAALLIRSGLRLEVSRGPDGKIVRKTGSGLDLHGGFGVHALAPGVLRLISALYYREGKGSTLPDGRYCAHVRDNCALDRTFVIVIYE